jgi:hypothetical protein
MSLLDPARLLPHGDGSVSSVAQLLVVLRSTEQGATDLAELQQVTPLQGRRPGETECFAWGARTSAR